MEKFNGNKLKEIKDYDYLSKINEIDLPLDMETVLRWGHHAVPSPLLNVIIPTYKRPVSLKKTLNSILNSNGFDNYQIIIIDNEGINENIEITETEQIIINLNTPKIVYYRNQYNTPFSWNRLIKYAQADWLCMIHDDDMISNSLLKTMFYFINLNTDIQYLGCQLRKFSDEKELNISQNIKKIKLEYISCERYIYGFQIPLLGAFFKRKLAMELGGFDTIILSGIGDYIFVAKYAYYFGTYILNVPLYYYRISSTQASADTIGEFNNRISDYYLCCNIVKHTSKLFTHLYLKQCQINLVLKVQEWNKSHNQINQKNLNLNEILNLCEIKKYKLNKSIVSKLTKYLLWKLVCIKDFHRNLQLKSKLKNKQN